MDVRIPWQSSCLSRSRLNKIDPCGWTVRFFFGKVLELTCEECTKSVKVKLSDKSGSVRLPRVLAAILVDSSVQPTWRPHTLPCLSNMKKEIATTLPKRTLDNQKSVSGVIRMCSFQLWEQKCAICYFEECCISVQPTNSEQVDLVGIGMVGTCMWLVKSIMWLVNQIDLFTITFPVNPFTPNFKKYIQRKVMWWELVS